MSKGKAILLCRASDVPPGSVKQVELAGHDDPFAVYNLDGTYYLTDDTCTHAMASLSDGDIEDGVIVCPLHGGAFDIKSGKAVEAPCTLALKVYEIYREGDELFGIIDA